MKFIIILTLNICAVAYGQAPKKVSKIIGDDFKDLKVGEDYELSPFSKNTFYPSWTKKGDTTGVSNGSEYLLFKDSITFYKNELFKLFKTDFVSNKDWNEYQDRVMDSVMREKIYLNTDPTSKGSNKSYLFKLRNVDPKYKDGPGEDLTTYYQHVARSNHNYDFDWRKKMDSRDYIPLLSDMYASPSQRFWRGRIIEERKIHYKFNTKVGKEYRPIMGIEYDEICATRDHDVWAASSKHTFDMSYNFTNYYGKSSHYENKPVVGVLGTQIKGYLDYKREQIQSEIDHNGLPYKVFVSLPSEDELSAASVKLDEGFFGLSTPSKNMTEQWRITNQDYSEFLSWVEDSICRELIYRNDFDQIPIETVGEMLKYTDEYYDEVNLEWSQFDPSKPFVNRQIFNMDKSFDWKKKIDKAKRDSLLERAYEGSEFKRDKYKYRYYWIDYERRSRWGEFEWVNNGPESYSYYECKDFYKGCRDYDMSNGVRRNEDNGRFVIEESVMLYPGVNCRDHTILCNVLCDGNDEHTDKDGNYIECGNCTNEEFKKEPKPYDFTSNPEGLIQNLTYHQALAYYNWKYQKQNVFKDSETAIYDDLVPSEEEFKKVQAGEKVEYKGEQIAYPSPLFRYVVHFYKK
jgi:hypothetical protein